MNPPSDSRETLLALCDRLLDGDLPAEDRAQLEALVLADAAHLPHVESARAVNERVVRWLTERR